MRLPKTLPQESVQRIKELLIQSQTKADFQRILCLWLQVSLNLSIAQVALAVGWSEEKVRKVRSAYFRHGETALIGLERGGAKHRNLKPEEEIELITPLWENFGGAKKVLAAKVKEAYEEKVGRPVPKSTVYRMLKRCGWQKNEPNSRFRDSNTPPEKKNRQTGSNTK